MGGCNVFGIQFEVILCLAVGQKEVKLELLQHLKDNECKQESQYLFIRVILSYFDTPRYVFYFLFVVFHFSKDLIRIFFYYFVIVC